MSSDEAPKRARLVVDISHEEVLFADVEVLDANLTPIALPEDSDDSIALDLPLGMYEVTFRIGDATRTEYATLKDEGSTVVVAPTSEIAPSSSVPLFGTATTHEYHAYPAQHLSHSVPVSVHGGGSGALLVFVRDPTNHSPGNRGRGLTLCSLDGAVLFDFEQDGHQQEQEQWAGAHLELPPDTYLLHLERRGDWRWATPIVIRPDFQTQAFFVAYDSGAAIAAERFADLRSMTILMSSRMDGYDPDNAEFRSTHAALAALTRGSRLARGDRRSMLSGKFKNPMLGIYAAHLMIWRFRKRQVDLLREVIGNLHAMIGPHPDVDALRLALWQRTGVDHFEDAWPLDPLATLPMLHRSWKRWVQATDTTPQLIPVGSIADRASLSATSMGPWFAFAPTEVGDYAADADPAAVTGVLERIQEILGQKPELMTQVDAQPLQQQIAYSLVPAVSAELGLPNDRRLLSVLRRPEPASVQAANLTDRFHVPRGTAVRAASSLLSSLETHTI
ncbi:MAG: hypothetical protein AAGF12_06655 [Myxococcota bacterium]